MPVNHVLLSAVGRGLPTAVTAGQPQCTIYDTHNTTRLPSDVVRTEEKWPSRDLAVDEAYDGLGDRYNLYWQVYQRNSIDDQGLPLDATVHFDQHYDNAFWNGERVVFGDADGVSFNRFTIPSTS
jgi:Zn-dependent metalloprotease